jgi:hypothetical protein
VARQPLATILILGCVLSGCQVRCGGPGTEAGAGYLPISAKGPEAWTIDGMQYQIASTYYLALPEGFQFTMEIPVDAIPRSEDAAIDQTWPIIRHVYQNGIYRRTSISGPGGQPRVVGRIGVALFRRDGIHTQGIRAGLGLGDVRYRLDAESEGKRHD